MSGFDRIEQRMPELMAELAPATVPDYFDDMLRQTGRTRQRPAWASLERWLPMDTVARPVPVRAPALRPLMILLLIGLLIAAGLAMYAGSQRTRLPAPFGPARNGVVAIATADQDVVALDPVTGATTPLIVGPTKDIAPWFARDGQRFMFVRLTGEDVGAYWVANADGSEAREIVPAPVDWFAWSETGDRIVATRLVSGSTETSIVDVERGTTTALNLGVEINHPYWRPGHDQIMFSEVIRDAYRAYYLVDADGTNLRAIEGVAPGAINDPQLSPDGSKLAYATWGSGDGTGERIHVLDIDTGTDTLATPDADDGYLWQDVLFSPDGTTLLTKRYLPGTYTYQLAIIPANGRGDAVLIGPEQPDGTGAAVQWEFSPDGTQVLAFYGEDESTWLLDVDGDGIHQLPWSGANGTSWQRLAP